MINQKELDCGGGPLFMDPDPDTARAFFKKKARALTDKVMTVRDAVSELIKDGDYLASGGFGTNRICTAILHEILRQKKNNLSFAGHTTTHDFQILAAGNLDGRKLMVKVDAAYIIGLEARGLSAQARRTMQNGEVEVCDWSNYALACRFKAAAMGVSFLPIRSMLGTDTFHRSGAKVIECPFTGKKYAAVPALYPDVAFIHVHESDCYGNCRIKGISVADFDIARAAKKLIITTERIIPNEVIRDCPDSVQIPAPFVDAVCEVPYGSYPGNMGGVYFSDEAHLGQWLKAEKDEADLKAFLEKYIYETEDFEGYLSLCGGEKRIEELHAIETGKDQ
jgi:glutaconate CoA-transferase, subunit A